MSGLIKKICLVLGLMVLLAGNMPFHACAQDMDGRHEIIEFYRHILGREPDIEGLKYWTLQYNKGMSLEQIKQAFYTSEEYRNLHSAKPVIQEPQRDISFAREKIDGFYRDILGREPDAEGYQYWVQRCVGGMPLEQIKGAFYNSSEYQRIKMGLKTGYEGVNRNTEPRELIINFYRQLLNRYPSQEDLRHWLKEHKDGVNLENIRQIIAAQQNEQNHLRRAWWK